MTNIVLLIHELGMLFCMPNLWMESSNLITIRSIYGTYFTDILFGRDNFLCILFDDQKNKKLKFLNNSRTLSKWKRQCICCWCLVSQEANPITKLYVPTFSYWYRVLFIEPISRKTQEWKISRGLITCWTGKGFGWGFQSQTIRYELL